MSEQDPRDDQAASPRALEPGTVGRILAARVPAWLVLVVALLVGVTAGAVLIAEVRSDVHLGPSIAVAQTVDVQITLCNRDVDQRHINPRAAELDLEKILRKHGARAADVVIDRRDCPTVGPAPTGSP